MPVTPAFLLLLAVALVFAYLNGVTDSANVVAPVISSRAIAPRRALVLAALSMLVAPFIFGVAVARTFGTDIISPDIVTLPVVIAGVLSAVVWRWLTWWWGLPSSSSHGLVGGLLGAGLAGAGWAAVSVLGLFKVVLALFISPAVGLLIGFIITRVIYFLAQWATPRINLLFRNGQVLTAMVLALSWGANDAQKTAGVLALGLAAGTGQAFEMPWWVIVVSMATVGLGTLTGGWRLIRTLGGRFYRIRPIHGLAAQMASASVMFAAAVVGGPVSTTQVVSTAILGAGAAERVSKVRWGVAGDIFWAWAFTIPATALLGAVLVLPLRALLE